MQKTVQNRTDSEQRPEILNSRANQLVNGPRLLEELFEQESRPSLRWLRDQTRHRTIPFVRQGRLVFFDPNEVREHLRLRTAYAPNMKGRAVN